MSESVEVRVARLEENMKFLVKDAEQASAARKSQYQAIEAIQSTVTGMATTIEEFITIKHKVVGAGRLGKWLWAVGAFLLGTASGAREHIIAWLTIK
jgi:hypothetical protein